MQSMAVHKRVYPFSFVLKDKYFLQDADPSSALEDPNDQLRDAAEDQRLSVAVLCTAISRGCNIAAIKAYLEVYHDRYAPEDFKNMMVLATPALYYAIGKNAPELVTLLLDYGLDPNGLRNDAYQLPPIAFAVINGHLQSCDTTNIVEMLLASGVDPRTIPEDMWENYMEKPRDVWPAPPKGDKRRIFLKWCDKATRIHLARGLNLSQRYALFRSSLCRPFTEREIQSAELNSIESLLKLPFHIIGQIPVIEDLQHYILNHIAAAVDDPEPLVVVFAGPPGHGKTELAKQLGDLLSVKQETIACSQMKTDTELFGSKAGYARSEQGSTLNNLLAQNSGRCSVAFLDEFDKTSREVCASLLTIMSEGEYEDRCTNRKIDCNKTIWILASNLGDQVIARFYEEALKDKQDKEKSGVDLTPLITELRDLFKVKWGDAFESRIEYVAPFFQFSLGEQAVVTHKFLRKNAANVRKDIDLRPEVKRAMGHCILSYQDEEKLCGYLAKCGYRSSSGARGLKLQATKVSRAARSAFSTLIPGRVDESMNDGPFEKLEAKLTPSGNGKQEIKVVRRQDASPTTGD